MTDASVSPEPAVQGLVVNMASVSDWASECSTVADEAEILSWSSDRPSPVRKTTPSLWERRKGNSMRIAPFEGKMEVKETCKLQYEPEVSGKYDVKELLGSGSLAIVHRAVRREDREKQVALKALRCRTDPEAVKVARREFEILKALPAHPNIIAAFDFLELATGGAVLVLEYAAGSTLEVATKTAPDRRLPSSSVQHLGVALFKALAHLHQNGVLHRDVKPSNVFVSACLSELRLADFNVAKDLASGESFTPVGTPQYRAPELAWGESCAESSDVWSAGLSMLFAFMGRLPQQGVASIDVEALLSSEIAPDMFKASLCLAISVEKAERPPAIALASEDAWGIRAA